MADIYFINKTFKQQSAICAMASYATIIEYFSEGEMKIEEVLNNYLNHFSLTYIPEGKKRIFKKHTLIYDHFHNYCIPIDMRGFEFIKQLHENDFLGSIKYCQIVSFKAQQVKISDEDIENIKKEIIENEALAIVIYKVTNNIFHAVTIGFDSSTNNFILKDPEKNMIESTNILLTNDIYEFMVFNDY